MKPEEKPQEPLKTLCRMCEGAGEIVLSALFGPQGCEPEEASWCPTCKGAGYEEKP